MKSVHRLMQRAVERGVFPGGALLVSCKREICFLGTYGVGCLRTRRPVTQDTVFDLASLTKPLATTLAIMRLTEMGRLDLDDRLGKLLPPFYGSNKSGITVRQLLCHRSGLPAYRPYFIPLSNVASHRRQTALREFLIRETLVGRPGKNRLYSDIGFMILQWLVEWISGQRLERFAVESVYRPMGAGGVFFPAMSGINALSVPFAATERCDLRQRVVDGEVHDENAYIMGGAAGHAGLFGTPEAVWRLLVQLIDIYKGRTNQGGFRRETAAQFFIGRAGWGPLGFDAPASRGSSAGRFFGPRSLGHLGFTGTSFWMDLDREIIVVLLTNRIHPSRNNFKIKAFRPQLHDEIMKTLAVEK